MFSDEKSMAAKIIEHDPNGLVVLNEELKIVKFNKSFLKIFKLAITKKIVGENINEILGQNFFPSSDINSEAKKIKFHNKSERSVKTITFNINHDNLQACFFVDITSHFQSKKELKRIKEETISKARKVINNQMSVAQEIASLLGETTAESKATLLKLIAVMQEGEIDE